LSTSDRSGRRSCYFRSKLESIMTACYSHINIMNCYVFYIYPNLFISIKLISLTWAWMAFRDDLSSFFQRTRSISEYIQPIEMIVDEPALLIISPLDKVDLVINTLNGLGLEYKRIWSAAIRARENPITFEELEKSLLIIRIFEEWRGYKQCIFPKDNPTRTARHKKIYPSWPN
jgi:hypothetical protein